MNKGSFSLSFWPLLFPAVQCLFVCQTEGHWASAQISVLLHFLQYTDTTDHNNRHCTTELQ